MDDLIPGRRSRRCICQMTCCHLDPLLGRQQPVRICARPDDDDSSDSRYRRNVETGQVRVCTTRRGSVAPGRIAAAELEVAAELGAPKISGEI